MRARAAEALWLDIRPLEAQSLHVLVTGSAGVVGQHVVTSLAEAGHRIRTLDRTAAKHPRADDHFPADVRDAQAVRRAMQDIEAVAHLAAIPHDRAGQAEDVLHVNVQGTVHILLAASEAGARSVVFLSSVNALGSFGGHRPSTRLPIDDDYSPHPMTPYQLSKRLAEEACRCFTDRHGLATVCLRPVMVATEWYYRRRWRFAAADRAEWARHDYWAYVDVRDVCDAVAKALEVEGPAHIRALLAANDTSLDVPTAELVDRFYADTPWNHVSREEYLRDQPYRSLVDCRAARERLAWQPRHSWRSETAADD